MTRAMEIARKHSAYAVEARHWLHRNAELSMQEHKTTAYLKQQLLGMGAEVADLPGLETGVVAIIRGEKPNVNTVTGLRADIDALPIDEKTGAPYASCTPGVMHACGHDGHTAILLGTARALMQSRHLFGGTVKLIFQPAEENLDGALAVIRAGGLDNPPLDRIAMLHGWPYLEAGDVGAWEGQYMASSDTFSVTITGKSGHGCRPYAAVNPITAAAHVITALSGLVSSEIVTAEQAVVSVCALEAGTTFNIIPEQAVIRGTVRCLSVGVQNQLKERMERIVSGVCAGMGCTGELEYVFGIPSLTCDAPVVQGILRAAQAALGSDHIKSLDGPVMGGEDFAHLRNHVGQGALLRLGLGDPSGRVLHNDHFDFNDQAIETGIAVWIEYVLATNQAE